MGVEFLKGKVARITEDENQTPTVRVELIDEFGKTRVTERQHDLVVLSVGLLPGGNPQAQFGVPVGEDGFIQVPDYNLFPAVTSQPGIFVTGTAAGPMDIVDSIMMAGAAASATASYLETGNGSGKEAQGQPERSVEYA